MDDDALELVPPTIWKPKPLWTGKQVRCFYGTTSMSLLTSVLTIASKDSHVTFLFTGYNNHIEPFNKRSPAIYCGAEGENFKRISNP